MIIPILMFIIYQPDQLEVSHSGNPAEVLTFTVKMLKIVKRASLKFGSSLKLMLPKR